MLGARLKRTKDNIKCCFEVFTKNLKTTFDVVFSSLYCRIRIETWFSCFESNLNQVICC